MTDRKLRIGAVGLGRAFSLMLPTLLRHPLIEVVAGADPRDPSSSHETLDLGAGRGRPLRSLKAAVIPTEWGAGTEPEARAAFDAGVKELEAAGLSVHDAKFPDYPASEVSGLLIGIEALTAFDPSESCTSSSVGRSKMFGVSPASVRMSSVPLAMASR